MVFNCSLCSSFGSWIGCNRLRALSGFMCLSRLVDQSTLYMNAGHLMYANSNGNSPADVEGDSSNGTDQTFVLV